MSKIHLDLEQCKNLAAWGMPQELDVGDWYYRGNYEYDDGYNENTPYIYFPNTQSSSSMYPKVVAKIPSLDELLEFARGLDDEWQLEPADNQWGICKYFDDEWWWVKDHNPKLAVYKLIEKLIEVHDD